MHSIAAEQGRAEQRSAVQCSAEQSRAENSSRADKQSRSAELGRAGQSCHVWCRLSYFAALVLTTSLSQQSQSQAFLEILVPLLSLAFSGLTWRSLLAALSPD